MQGKGAALAKRIVGIAVSLAVVAAAVVLGRDYLERADRNPLSQDAVLTANVARIASAVPGRIARIGVTENGSVRKGDLLLALEAEPYSLAVAQARADLAIAEAGLADQQRTEAAERSNAVIASEQVTRAEQNLSLATQTLARLQQLRPKGYVSAQQVDDAATARRDAEVSLRQARLQQDAAEKLVGNPAAAAALVAAREAALAIAERALADTEIRAPFAGKVVGLTVSPGDYLLTGQSVFTLIDTAAWFASASFVETELPSISVGDCATIYALADRTVPIRGRVEGTSWGVASDQVVNLPIALPIVPKSLDWVRIAQRFPVRIRVLDPPDSLMRIGASATVTVHHDAGC
ncbi:membrane fusion protein, multidrug efflux system [Kaistia soli DSM 19436]|uniref:Membrane fusion protein, multidrug efflux system n=1 Tax=Kaistia soli DSM 19436 TaxID=1122133 RepID=A0A1M5PCZ7_9HYPH|nr:membrane fusion protein, multidrug efflux system [Kaistia soli DSM 19436]